MSQEIKEFFVSRVEKGEQHRLGQLIDDVLSTEIGTRLLTNFLESAGTIEVVKKIEAPGARAQYSPSDNCITLTHKAASSDFIHELGHARQFSKRPDLVAIERMASPASKAHLSVLLESDCWALTAIYWKQFIRQNPQAAATLLDKERTAFSHLNSITPFRDKIREGVPSHVVRNVTEDNTTYFYNKLKMLSQFMMATIRGDHEHEAYAPDLQEDLFLLQRDVLRRKTDAKWAGSLFRKYAEGQSDEDLNAHQYTEDVLSDVRQRLGVHKIDASGNSKEIHRACDLALRHLSRLEDVSAETFESLIRMAKAGGMTRALQKSVQR